jgi:fido (protein-threonine AMPylation protein)
MHKTTKRRLLYKKIQKFYNFYVFIGKFREKLTNINENIARIDYRYLDESYIEKIILRASRPILERKNFGRLDKI